LGLTLQPAFFDPILGEPGVAQVIGGEIDQGHDFLASEMGKPPPQDRENGLNQIRPWFQNPIGGAADFGFAQHRQREQAEQGSYRLRPSKISFWRRLVASCSQLGAMNRFHSVQNTSRPSASSAG
jgi:hypothetical protein